MSTRTWSGAGRSALSADMARVPVILNGFCSADSGEGERGDEAAGVKGRVREEEWRDAERAAAGDMDEPTDVRPPNLRAEERRDVLGTRESDIILSSTTSSTVVVRW